MNDRRHRDRRPAPKLQPAPGLGEHNAELERRLGLNPSAVAALKGEGVI